MKTTLQIASILFTLLLTNSTFAQNAVQTVKGNVFDKASEIPLTGAAIEWLGPVENKGTVTDIDGDFKLENIPVGRQEFRVSYLGYNTFTIPNVVVTAGKEVILDIALEESVIQMNEVVVTAEVEKDRASNEMATVSARAFSVEEVTRYSGGRNDVSRLVSNFAGVSTADDSRNDIVIRGNSPTGVLWRLEGVPIPNPNHFSTLGTTGGPVSALNTNLLKNSDFLTGAFPAEYGNATAGVFDISFRSGNKDRFEATAQLAAFSGLEAMVEGPLSSKNNSSFVLSFRNSFVELADVVGIPTGTTATPAYRDLSFKVDFANGKAGKFSLFGIGGTSNIEFLGAETEEDDLFANPNTDSKATSLIGIVGLRHNLILNNTTYLRTVVSASTAQNTFVEEEYFVDKKLKVTDIDDVTDKYIWSTYLNKKYNSKLTLRSGVLAEYTQLNTQVDDRVDRPDLDEDGEPDWATVRDFNGGFLLLQVYSQSQYKFDEKLTLNAGIHGQWLTFNDTYSIEPRLAINYKVAKNQTVSLAYGLHNQTQPLPVFFFKEEVSPGVFEPTNNELDFTRSQHFVAAYDIKWNGSWRTKIETYYQAIDRVPVESETSSFSILNAGADFVFPQVGFLVNEGKGTNYGFELTVEKFFSKGYYGLLSASAFDSKYEGSDGVKRNTSFNNNYVVNFLAGKEFKIGKAKRNAITLDMKLTNAGGRYYTPVDLPASQLAEREVLKDDLAFSEQFDPYFKLDVKFGFQLNSKKKKFSQQFFIDFQNITDNQNVFTNRYNPLTNKVNTVYQSGFFPDLLYRVQF